MNSYTENLNSTIVASLQNQEQEQKTLQSQLNASLFSLYYAQGATITAKERAKLTEEEVQFSNLVKSQAIDGGNTAANLFTSASQANQYAKQATTNAAVCAANVQVAANAIVRLAGDIGSIYSIIQAADYGSDIFTEASTVKDVTNDTAQAAEVASQVAMEASVLTAEVSASTVLDQAKKTSDSLNNLVKLVSDDFDKVKQLSISNGAGFDTATTNEQIAKGAFEDIQVDYTAAQNAYALTNKMLNLNLSVFKLTDTSYEVIFDEIVNPFDKSVIVKNYYIILVKESKKLTFSISNAENIFANIPNQLILTGKAIDGEIKTTINFIDSKILDSDGDQMQFGTNYVAFVFAVYADDYKKEVNNYDDFLSAPSPNFCLTYQLKAVDNSTIKIDDTKSELTFEIPDNKDHKCEYRCMFLPTGAQGRNINFSFNVMLAEQVAAGNYTLAVEDKIGIMHIPIDVETTDVFGNLLSDGKQYIPVILSMADELESDLNKYTNAMSDFNTTSHFIYKSPLLKK